MKKRDLLGWWRSKAPLVSSSVQWAKGELLPITVIFATKAITTAIAVVVPEAVSRSVFRRHHILSAATAHLHMATATTSMALSLALGKLQGCLPSSAC